MMATYLSCSSISDKHELECRGRLSASSFSHLRRSCDVCPVWYLIEIRIVHCYDVILKIGGVRGEEFLTEAKRDVGLKW